MEEKKIIGYMRVSSREQNEDRQRIALLEMGVPEKNIYIDKLSGKDFNRPQYKRMLKKLDSNTVLFVKSIDRLGAIMQTLTNSGGLSRKKRGQTLL